MKYEETEQKLNTSDFSIIEKKLEVILPNDFKNHYLENNGGYPPYENVKGKNHIIYSLNSFYPIKYGRLPIEKLIDSFQKSSIFFGKKVPFAYDNGGNIFLLSLEKDITVNKILLIEAEFLNEYKYHEVSDSFSEFINSFI